VRDSLKHDSDRRLFLCLGERAVERQVERHLDHVEDGDARAAVRREPGGGDERLLRLGRADDGNEDGAVHDQLLTMGSVWRHEPRA